MIPVLVDANILLDIATSDPHWGRWSENMVVRLVNTTRLVINPIIFAEISIGYDTIEAVNALFDVEVYDREPLPFEAGFLAGKAYLAYKRRGGIKNSPLPDFYIGAHAAIRKYRLLTRDAARYRTYFPSVEIITPNLN